jgi:hypothetical protein
MSDKSERLPGGEYPVPPLLDERGRIVWRVVGKERADELYGLAWRLAQEHNLSPFELEYLAQSLEHMAWVRVHLENGDNGDNGDNGRLRQGGGNRWREVLTSTSPLALTTPCGS